MAQDIDTVVLDGGGTGTRLRALGPDGETLSEAAAGPSSLTLGVAQAWRNVSAGLADLARDTGRAPRARRLVCGLAGGRSPERQAAFRDLARDTVDHVVIVTDGFASLLGAHGGRPGVVLAIGTGVAAYALTPAGHVQSASAWGFAIGDEGSGAWIGRRAVSLLSRRMDGRLAAESEMLDAVAAEVGAAFNEIQHWLTGADATRFATLAPRVVEASRNGDPLARALMDEATEELEAAIDAGDAGGEIALLGGLGPVFAPHLSPRLRDRVRPAMGSALDGLALMAARGWRDETVPPEVPR